MSTGEETVDMALTLRGSVITLKRKCGKPGCHCARGTLHENPALSLNVGGKTRIVTLRPAELPEVKAALARYKRARMDLDEQVRAGLAFLQARRQHSEPTKTKAPKKGAPSSQPRRRSPVKLN
jgi:hypothetical protein